MKFPTAENMSEQMKIEAGIGFTSGIMVGAISAFVLIMFYTTWEWYFKLFSAIGSLGIIGSLYMALSGQIQQRRSLIAAKEEMKKIKEAQDNLNKKEGGIKK